ncbi:CocE/NonD family hydrolase, partial [Candidatus Neomarinimicrobiota bacterium]
MRDGKRLFTSIYQPMDTTRQYPILMIRTPYGISPYGDDVFPSFLGPNAEFDEAGYIFVYQDVRGTHLSEGDFKEMTPHIAEKSSTGETDESSDTWDTIQWLLDNIPDHNGKIGQWGISYPGFFAAAGMIDHHPALTAVSPQGPIADFWYDDYHHNGAFFLPHSFEFMYFFGFPRPEPTTRSHPRFRYPDSDGYQFYLDLGSLSNIDIQYFQGEVSFWNDIIRHPNYDAYWEIRNIVPHLQNAAPAVLTVGGWFDAEDLYGPLAIYQSIEEKNPGIFNILVMGPWSHGQWGNSSGQSLGGIDFGSRTGDYFRENIELPFFEYYLKGEGDMDLSEATMFETGSNAWRRFDEWPPAAAQETSYYLAADGKLSASISPELPALWDEYVSNPFNPVPYTDRTFTGMARDYIIHDQRFAGERPDVLVYQTNTLDSDVTLAGQVVADLWVSTSGTSSDWIVKLIDVFPDSAGSPLDSYQMMVRGEVMRGRFRNSNEYPEPFESGLPTRVVVRMQDILHTFRAGHRIMVQIQSSWFPLVDRNPQ